MRILSKTGLAFALFAMAYVLREVAIKLEVVTSGDVAVYEVLVLMGLSLYVAFGNLR